MIDRVIDLSEGRSYSASRVLLYLDVAYYDFSETKFHFMGLTPVYSDATVPGTGKKARIGFAHVSLVDRPGRVMAEIFIDYATEERFLAETRSVELYAHPVGAVGFVDDMVEPNGVIQMDKPLKILHVRVDEILVSTRRKSDALPLI